MAYEVDAYIEDEDNNVIRGNKSMKALGMRFTIKPDMSEHVRWIEKSFLDVAEFKVVWFLARRVVARL